jgi:hypothetical protein
LLADGSVLASAEPSVCCGVCVLPRDLSQLNILKFTWNLKNSYQLNLKTVILKINWILPRFYLG